MRRHHGAWFGCAKREGGRRGMRALGRGGSLLNTLSLSDVEEKVVKVVSDLVAVSEMVPRKTKAL